MKQKLEPILLGCLLPAFMLAFLVVMTVLGTAKAWELVMADGSLVCL